MSDLDELAAAKHASYRFSRSPRRSSGAGVIIWVGAMVLGIGGLVAWLALRDSQTQTAAVQQVIAQQTQAMAARQAEEAKSPTTGAIEGHLQPPGMAVALPPTLYLLRPDVSQTLANQCLQDACDRWQILGDKQHLQADDLRETQAKAWAEAQAKAKPKSDTGKQNQVFDVPHDLKSISAMHPGRNHFDDESDLSRRRLAGLKAAIAAMPEKMSPAWLYNQVVVQDEVAWPAFDEITKLLSIGTESVDSDRSFKFAAVEPGLYYLYTASQNGPLHVQWLSPVRVMVGTTTHVDIVNQTAAANTRK